MKIARVALPERVPVRRVGLVWATQGPRVALALLAEAQALASAHRGTLPTVFGARRKSKSTPLSACVTVCRNSFL